MFCYGTEKQLTHFAPAPGAKKYTICTELSNRGCNLLGGDAFAHHGVAANLSLVGQTAPGLQNLCGGIEGAGGIVIRQSNWIDCHAGRGDHCVKQEQSRTGFGGLLKCEGHKSVEVA